MKLTPILANIQKYYPELNLSQFQNYCAQADAPETEKTNQFHFGYNSLKWALESINTINPDAVKNTMLFIIFEQNARNLPFKTIQHNINSYTAILPFKSQIQQRETINISTLQTIKASGKETKKEPIPTKKEPEKWLNVDSEEWNALAKLVEKGTNVTLAQVRKKYKVSKETQKALETLNIF